MFSYAETLYVKVCSRRTRRSKFFSDFSVDMSETLPIIFSNFLSASPYGALMRTLGGNLHDVVVIDTIVFIVVLT